MHDLHARRCLLDAAEAAAGGGAAAAEVSPDALVDALQSLAELPIEDRWPHLAAVAAFARHPAPAVRAACLRALGGSCGLPAERLVLAGLRDGEPAVQDAALDAVRASTLRTGPAHGAWSWWAHLVLHSRAELRAAAAREAPTGLAGAWVRLLADPEVAATVQARLEAEPPDAGAVLALLQHRAAGHVDGAWLARLLGTLPWLSGLPGLLAGLGPARPLPVHGPGRPEDLDEQVAAAAAVPDLLDSVLEVILGQGRPEDAAALLAGLLADRCAGRLPDAEQDRLSTSLLVLLLGRRVAPTAGTVALCAVTHPGIVGRKDLPPAARRGALDALVELGSGSRRHLDPAHLDARALVLGRGGLRGEALAGLCALGGPATLQVVVSWSTPDAVARALGRAGEAGASLLARDELHDPASRALRDRLLPLVVAHGGAGLPPLLASLLLRRVDVGLAVLGLAIDRDPEVVSRVVLLLDRALAERSNAEGRTGRIAQGLVPLLRAPLETVAELLRRPSLDGPLLRRLVVEVLRHASGRAVVAALGVDGLERLCELDGEAGLLPFPLLQELAGALRDPPTENLRAWLAPVASPASASAASLPPPARRGRLDPATADRIRTCTEAALPRALAVALAAPMQGVVEALAARPDPGAPVPAACVALLLSDDPLPEVARQARRYGLGEPGCARVVDQMLVAGFAWSDQLGPAAAAWLHRWDRPHEAFARWLGGGPLDVLRVLRASLSLPSPELREVLWCSCRHLVGKWRWRRTAEGGSRLAGFRDSGLIEFLVATLGDLGASGRGPAGYPASRRDREEVQRAACQLLVRLRDGGIDLEPHRPQIQALLASLAPMARRELEAWISSRGLRTVRGGPDPEGEETVEAGSIEACTDLAALSRWLGLVARGVAELAALRLLELGPAGEAVLLEALLRPGAPHLDFLGASIPSWGAEPVLAAARRACLEAHAGPQARFHLAMGLCERPHGAAPDLLDAALAAVCAPDPTPWFTPVDLSALRRRQPDLRALALALAGSPQPVAYTWAVGDLADRLSDPACRAALVDFLHLGPDRALEVRVRVAEALRKVGDPVGSCLVLAHRMARARVRPSDPDARDWALHLPAREVEEAVLAGLLAGEELVPGTVLTDGLHRAGVDPLGVEAAAVALLRDARRADTQVRALGLLPTATTRQHAARRVAETFLWGRDQSRKLLGRVLHIRMIAGDELGWTRLSEPVIQVNPLPILRRERDAEAIVRGLVVHELGHHVYNGTPDGVEVGRQAQQERLSRLLNLVQDEHLERNLRARDPDWDHDLKRLAAWAFQHAARELPVLELFQRLGPLAVPALREAAPGAARHPGRLAVSLGSLLRSMEAQGSSFARFVRALRMGLGNRHGDARVGQALALFDRGFRASDNARLLQITRELAALFGDEVDLLDMVDVHRTASEGDGDELAESMGVEDGEVQRQVERIEKARSAPRDAEARRTEGPARGAGGRDQVNVASDPTFDPIHVVQPLPYDAAQAAALAREVARPARKLRELLLRLGLEHVPVRPRTAGHRLDRSRLPALALRGDPRALVSRQVRFSSDLFVGLAVDCSGSMQGARMERARRFAALMAAACQGLSSVDLRVFGFTDAVIYDAGDARRPAAHALFAGGGNNDAAGLLHVAQEAMASPRSARLLIMVSDGLPTECTTAALRALVTRLERRHGMVCAQVAVERLHERCFDTYIEVLDADADRAVLGFGRVVARLVTRTLKR